MEQGYIDSRGQYYEGDRYPGDPIVPKPPSPNHTWDFATQTWGDPIDARTAKQKLKDLITQGSQALVMASQPLPIAIRRQIYQLESETDIAFDRGDYQAVKAALESFVLPEESGLSETQEGVVNDLKELMMAIVEPFTGE